jgi:hypothetical protein
MSASLHHREAGGSETTVARLRIVVDDVEHLVERVVEVPVEIRLDDLHYVFQVAIGWGNCHTFEFRVADQRWGLVDRDLDDNPDRADSANLADLLALGSNFSYIYVFGEDWRHTVQLDGTAEAQPAVGYPRLVSANGRCPPEDIGGPDGFETYLSAIANPEHLLHEGMLDWEISDFNPAECDLPALQRNVDNLRKYLGRRRTN